MQVQNLTGNTYFLGRVSLMLGPGATITVDDAIYNNDNAVANAINNLDEDDKVTVTSAPPGYPRSTGDAGGGQPLDSDLTAIAALTTTTFGRALLEAADNAALTSKVRHVMELIISDPATTPTTGDGKAHGYVTPEIAGKNLVAVYAWNTTVSSSGAPSIAIRRERSGSAVDMLSTNVTIDANEKTSLSAATGAVINTSNDDVASGDIIFADLDAAGTGTKGVGVALVFA